MAKNLLGIDIGSGYLKLAVVDESNRVSRVACERLPENLVRGERIVSFDAMADFIKASVRKNNISAKNCAVALSGEDAFVRRVSLPMMSVDQLELNLPYEFKDYLGDDQAKYRFDYAVLRTINDENGKPAQVDLLACACADARINEYSRMLKRAGLKLKVAAPGIMAYVKAVRLFVEHNPNAVGINAMDFCFAELGSAATKVHLFPLGQYDMTRSMDFGTESLIKEVANHFGVAEAIALSYYDEDFEGAQHIQECADLYERAGVELSRVVNFFNFNYQNSSLSQVLYSGTATRYEPLMDELRTHIPVEFNSVKSVMLPTLRPDDDALLNACFTAIYMAAQ